MHTMELQWIEWIQQFRTPLSDLLFFFLRIFDRQEFFFILIPFIWINYGTKNGMRLFYILFFNTILNGLLKEIFQSPRPCDLVPEVGLFKIGGFGLPSGAAQTTMLLSCLFLYYRRHNPWKWLIVTPYFLLVSFSRVYLGVHFITDILAGWMFGLLIFFATIYLIPRIEKRLENKPFYKLLVLHLFVIIAVANLSNISYAIPYIGCSVGIAAGLWLLHLQGKKLPLSSKWDEYLVRSVLSISGVFAIFLTRVIPAFPQAFLAGFWISFIAPKILMQKPFLRKKKR